ncbi:unnamed protein product [Cylicostephanus goldi]|uniref:Uncharacterized protein n=1 Tax=Cylicostephanus goldi TaxID=71465 RepID=A0A3P7N4K4_CYLGO|nr:unnamed protein product [Cylicostephanus goldi]
MKAEFEAKEKKSEEEFLAKLNEVETAKNKEIEDLKSELESSRNSELSFKEAKEQEGALSEEVERLRKQLWDLEEKSQEEVV